MKRQLLLWVAAFLLTSLASGESRSQTVVLDTASMPWESGALRLSSDWQMKVLEDDPTTGRRVALAYLPPGRVSKEKRHYHQFRQWFYFLQGDIPVFDYISPQQKKARVNILRQGYFLDRPVASMHGEEGNPRSQAGTLFLMWLGSSAPIVDVPFEGPYPDIEYKDDRIIDTRAMDWLEQPDGTMIKTLAPDVRLLLLPPGWQGAWNPPSFRSAFVLSGEGTLEAVGLTFGLRYGSFIRQPAGETAKAKAGEVGCLLLEWYEGPLPEENR